MSSNVLPLVARLRKYAFTQKEIRMKFGRSLKPPIKRLMANSLDVIFNYGELYTGLGEAFVRW